MTAPITIASSALTATIAPLGAELRSLTDARGHDYLWHGDPAWWSGRAPLLFPVVGRLSRDTLRLGDARYPMPRHGFARHQRFNLIDQGAAHVLFRLRDGPATHAAYPFAFELDAAYAIEGAALRTTVTIRNTGTPPLPASFGFHPAFAWPLPGAVSRAGHTIAFACDEPARLHEVTAEGLVGDATRPTPLAGRTLALHDALFEHDALVWTDLASRGVCYAGPGGAALDIAFPDSPDLGIWTKPGAPFVCVEPWAGCADPPGYTGDFRERRGVFSIAPGETRSFRMTVAVSPCPADA